MKIEFQQIVCDRGDLELEELTGQEPESYVQAKCFSAWEISTCIGFEQMKYILFGTETEGVEVEFANGEVLSLAIKYADFKAIYEALNRVYTPAELLAI